LAAAIGNLGEGSCLLRGREASRGEEGEKERREKGG